MKKTVTNLTKVFSVVIILLSCTTLGNNTTIQPKIAWKFIEEYACLDRENFKELRDYIFILKGR